MKQPVVHAGHVCGARIHICLSVGLGSTTHWACPFKPIPALSLSFPHPTPFLHLWWHGMGENKETEALVLQQRTGSSQQPEGAWRQITLQSLRVKTLPGGTLFWPCKSLSRGPSLVHVDFWPTELWDDELGEFQVAKLE